MTTGSYIRDNESPYGASTQGWYNSKTWTGLDNPKGWSNRTLYITIQRWIPQKDKRGRVRWVYRPVKVRNPAKQKPPRRAQAEHPYTMSIVERRTIPGWYMSHFNDGTSTGPFSTNFVQHGFDGGGTLVNTVTGEKPARTTLNGNDQLKLINKLGEQIRGSSFNPAVSFAEAFESLDMITDTVGRLARSYRAVKRRNFAEAWSELVRGTPRRHNTHGVANSDWKSDAGSNWLQLQLGWKPLLSDVKSAAEAAASIFAVPASTRYRASVAVGGTSPGPNDKTSLCTTTIFNRRSVIAILTEETSSTLQFGLMHPELVAWEVVPYSFVVDYLLPVGDWLEARANVSSMSGKFVVTDKYVSTLGPISGGPGTNTLPGQFRRYSFSPEAGLFKRKTVTLSRTISTTLNVPRPEMIPLAQASSVNRCLTSLALLRNVFGR